MNELPDPIEEALQDIASWVISAETLKSALERIASLTTMALPSADATGITLIEDEQIAHRTYRAETAAASDVMAVELDEAQYTDGEGPCLEAIETNDVVAVQDLTEEERWPEFRRKALPVGLRSSLSIPLMVEDRSIGALNVYSRAPGGFEEHDLELARAFGAQIAVTLANIQMYETAREAGARTAAAMESRASIEQAKGMIMLSRNCSADEAFATMVSLAKEQGKPVIEIAADIIASAAGPEVP